ncbi:MAG: MarR family winged helix-turn-helix transcriptional regulator [Hyphomicrobiales bacterium]
MTDVNPAQTQGEPTLILGREEEAPVSEALTTAARMMRTRTAALLAAEGLFAGQDVLLLTLGEEKSLEVGEIAERLGVRAPTVSKTLTRLTEAGLVSRSSVSGDKRRVAARVTPKGRAKLDRIAEIRSRVERELLSDFDAKDGRRLRKLLRKAIKTIAASARGEQAVAPRNNGDGESH